MGATALFPIPKDEASWFIVLHRDTCVTTRIQTHTLLTRNTEVESSAVNRSATTRIVQQKFVFNVNGWNPT